MSELQRHEESGTESPEESGEGEGGQAPPKWTKAKKWALRIVPAALILLAGIHFVPMLVYSFSHESTDDAYVGATIVPVSPQVGGKVVRLLVREHQPVTEGDTLLVVDPTDYENQLAQRSAGLASAHSQREETRAALNEQRKALMAARAQLQAAAVQESLSRKEKDRYGRLLSSGSVSQSLYDQKHTTWAVDSARTEAARAALEQARATIGRLQAQLRLQGDQISEAQTSLQSARVQLGRTAVTAPATGVVAQKDVDLGQVVQPGEPLFSIVRQDSVYVDANFKETQIHDIRVGQRVEIDVDAYPGVTFHGTVASFQPGAGAAFSLLPPENATGNFVKIVRRVPVRIYFDPEDASAHPLWPGLSAEPHVETGTKPRDSGVATTAGSERPAD